jgi:membrane protease YdiL (CAAX protease family)
LTDGRVGDEPDGPPGGQPDQTPDGPPGGQPDQTPDLTPGGQPDLAPDLTPGGPPGGRTFSLEERPAPGLYLVAWLLSGLGLAVAFVGTLTQPPVAGVLVIVGVLLFATGLAAGAGYQVVARRSRPAAAYRGPSPLILFVLYLLVVNAALLPFVALGIVNPETPTGVFLAFAIQATGFIVIVWLFVIRTGAFRWSDLDLGRRIDLPRVASDALFGASVMVPVTFIAIIATAIVASALDAVPPDPLPPIETPFDALLVALVAAALAPIGEELFFRGFALSAWLRDLGSRSALVRSTVFFALVHLIALTAPTFDEGVRQALLVVVLLLPIGAFLGWLFLSRGLVAAVAAHVTYNGIGLLLTFLRDFIPPPSGPVTPG